jgi:hypothetical protein
MLKFYPGGIRIEGPDDSYENEVYEILDDQINKNPAGKIILQWIDWNPRYVTIKPFTGLNKCNADAGKTDMDDPDLHPSGKLYHLRSGVLAHQESTKMGTGAGADVELGFTPSNFPSCPYKGKFGTQPDETLFHELIHSLRMMMGLDDPIPMPKTDFEDEEEFLAMTAANVYMSAKYKSDQGLRGGNHMAPEPYKYPLSISPVVPLVRPPLSVTFLADPDYRKVMMKIGWLPAVETTFGLAAIPPTVAPYNPFHEFLFHLSRYSTLKPGFDYIKQYNNMVDAMKKNSIARADPRLSLEKRFKLEGEWQELVAMMSRWPDSDNTGYQ